MRLLGEKVDSCDDGGGISVKGDTTIHNYVGPLGWIMAAALVVALLLAGWGLYQHCQGAAATAIVNNNGATEPIAPANANWRLGIRVTSEP